MRRTGFLVVLALLALAALAGGWWAFDVTVRAAAQTPRVFLRLWSWVALPYAVVGGLLWWARGTLAPRALLLLGAGAVLLIGAWSMARHFGLLASARADASWWLLYTPVMQWVAALPAVCGATWAWLRSLREYRRRMWQIYTTRGGAWEPVVETPDEPDAPQQGESSLRGPTAAPDGDSPR